MILKDVMDELAARLNTVPSLTGRVYAYAPGSVRAPAAVVAYPEQIIYDFTGRRGADRIRPLPIVVMVGRPTEKSARDAASAYLSGAGAESIKAVVESGTYLAFHTVRVESADLDVVKMGGSDYLAAMFDLDIVGSGE